ncbi:hypothetical protein CKO12_09155 [Chromatium okenii]|uniref:Hpt domain-containing protein n=1 Tax=Chromatium okenii TaxID=61644 RepID=UPI0019059F1E|nr:Hpt domain-containing protein [Chromatium okenii]MBK1642037.1 hypothetical protein [Chromatium okenii]
MKDLPLPAACSNTTTALDVSILAALIGENDPALLRELLGVFQRSASAISCELLAAGAAGDMAQVHHLAHKLKSPARSSGALALGECCAALELASKLGDAAALTTLLAEFTTEMTAVEQALAQFISAAP